MVVTNYVIALFKLGGIAVVLAFIFGELQDDNKMIAQSMCAGAVMLVVCFAYILWNDVCLPLLRFCITKAVGEDAKDTNSIPRSLCGNDINISHIGDEQQGLDQYEELSVSSPIQEVAFAPTTQNMTTDNKDEEPSSQQKSPSSRLQTLEAKKNEESAEQEPSQREVSSSSSSSLKFQRTSRMQEEPSATQIADKVQPRQKISASTLVLAYQMKDDGANTKEESPSTLPIQEGPDLSNDHVNPSTSTQGLNNEKKGQEEEQTDEEPCLSSFRDNKSVSSVRASLSPLPSPSRLFERKEGDSSDMNDFNTMPESLGKASSSTLEPTTHSSSLDIDDNDDDEEDEEDDDIVYLRTVPADPDHSKRKDDVSNPTTSLVAVEDNISSLNSQLQQGEAAQLPAPEAQSFKHSPSAIMTGQKRKRDPGDRRAATRSAGISGTHSISFAASPNRKRGYQDVASEGNSFEMIPSPKRKAKPIRQLPRLKHKQEDYQAKWAEWKRSGPSHFLFNHHKNTVGGQDRHRAKRIVYVCECHACRLNDPRYCRIFSFEISSDWTREKLGPVLDKDGFLRGNLSRDEIEKFEIFKRSQNGTTCQRRAMRLHIAKTVDCDYRQLPETFRFGRPDVDKKNFEKCLQKEAQSSLSPCHSPPSSH